jgi:hypothetical protein
MATLAITGLAWVALSSLLSVWAAAAQPLNSIDLVADEHNTQIQLHTGSIVPYHVVSESPNKVVIDLEGVQAASTVKTDFNQSLNISHVIIQPRGGDKVRLTVRGHHLTAPTISFQPLTPVAKQSLKSSSNTGDLIQEVQALRSSVAQSTAQQAASQKANKAKPATVTVPGEDNAIYGLAVDEKAPPMTIGPNTGRAKASQTNQSVKAGQAAASESPELRALSNASAVNNELPSEYTGTLPVENIDTASSHALEDTTTSAAPGAIQASTNPNLQLSPDAPMAEPATVPQSPLKENTITIDLSTFGPLFDKLRSTAHSPLAAVWLLAISISAILAGLVGWRFRNVLLRRLNPLAQDLAASHEPATGFQQAMAQQQAQQDRQQVQQQAVRNVSQAQPGKMPINRLPIGLGGLSKNSTQQLPPAVAQALAAGIAPANPTGQPLRQPPTQAMQGPAPVASKQVVNQYRQQQGPQAQGIAPTRPTPTATKPAPTATARPQNPTRQALLSHAQQQRQASQQDLVRQALRTPSSHGANPPLGKPLASGQNAQPAAQSRSPLGKKVQPFQPLQLSPKNATLPANEDVLNFLKKVAEHMDEDKRQTILQSIEKNTR